MFNINCKTDVVIGTEIIFKVSLSDINVIAYNTYPNEQTFQKKVLNV